MERPKTLEVSVMFDWITIYMLLNYDPWSSGALGLFVAVVCGVLIP